MKKIFKKKGKELTDRIKGLKERKVLSVKETRFGYKVVRYDLWKGFEEKKYIKYEKGKNRDKKENMLIRATLKDLRSRTGITC